MLTTAFIHIWNQRLGAIAWNPDTGIATFEYDQNFITKNYDLAPLKMPIRQALNQIYSFPELKNQKTFRGLPGLLADVLPDKYGHALINAWLARQGRASNSLSPVELLCFIGNRGMGALEFEPAIPNAFNATTSIEVSALIGIAEQILNGKKKFKVKLKPKEEQAMLDILKIGTSAGGARAKALIAFNPKTNEVRSGQSKAPKGFSHWIIKFDGVTDAQFAASKGYGRVEMAYYLMAKDAGIQMTESRLLEEEGRAHFMTRRFDRPNNSEKLHVQSFCALQHFDFNEVNSYSYEQLFETMRQLRLPYGQAEQMFRRMVFNVMSRNCDDHTKNFAFMMDKKGTWSLAPAFDLCHAYRPGSTWVSQHSLSINGKRKNIKREDLIIVAKQMNIKKTDKIITQITQIISNWNSYAEIVGVEKTLKLAIAKTLLLL